MTRIFQCACGAVAALMFLNVPLRAQGADKTAKQHEHDCARAARRVEKGHPEKKRADAMATLFSCGGSAGAALAAAVGTYTTEADTAALREFWQYADSWRDAALFNAAVTLANNPSATPEARVFAVRHLLVLANPYKWYAYAGLIAGDSTTIAEDGTEVTTFSCGAMLTSEASDLVGTPLPVDVDERIQATLEALASDAAAPESVRNAARCSRS